VNRSLKTAALSFGIALLFAGVALAHGSGSGTQIVKITLKGTGGGSAPPGNVGPDGQCINAGDPWLDDYTGTCSVPGNCSCGVLTSPTVSGSGLTGVANFFVTNDAASILPPLPRSPLGLLRNAT